MAKKRIVSKKGELQWRDIVRGALIAALTSALLIIQQSLDAGLLVFEWQSISMAAIAGGVSYLLKNWLIEPSKEITIDN